MLLREGATPGQPEFAEARQALRYDPENRPALSQLIAALRKLGREQEAATAAERLRRQYERDLAPQSTRRLRQ